MIIMRGDDKTCGRPKTTFVNKARILTNKEGGYGNNISIIIDEVLEWMPLMNENRLGHEASTLPQLAEMSRP